MLSRSLICSVPCADCRLDEKTAELTSVREELDGAKDEQELAQQAADDSAALLRSTDAQLKKLERATAALVREIEQRELMDAMLAQLESELAAAIKQAVANSSGARTAPPTPAPATAAAKARAPVPASPAADATVVASASPAVAPSSAAAASPTPSVAASSSSESPASAADTRRVELEASRRRAAEEEEQRRAALFADADAISSQYTDGAPAASASLAPPLNSRSASQLLADLPDEGADEDVSSFKQDVDRSYLQDE